jgi:hypothetical protein
MYVLTRNFNLSGLKAELERCKAEKKKAEVDLTSQESSFKQQVRCYCLLRFVLYWNRKYLM